MDAGSTGVLVGASVNGARDECTPGTTYAGFPVACFAGDFQLEQAATGSGGACESAALRPCIQGCAGKRLEFREGWRPLPREHLPDANGSTAGVFACAAPPRSLSVAECALTGAGEAHYT